MKFAKALERQQVTAEKLVKASKKLENAKSNALVMHPGPINRDVEIESSLADDVNKSVINEQVENGVAVRKAIKYLLASKL